MKQYTPDNPPKRGNGRRIWNALVAAKMRPEELHYNPNCWGRMGDPDGWGTWICSYANYEAYRCGITEGGEVYIQQLTAPYRYILVEKAA